ncbi:CoA-acylating methylmalonate-semialdehyde dehydrogenase [Streptomyces qaidamensis]|uniref:CoA-acylating methylmalonate-semialdehyde dehydrogenase n=1 Tax=Streptomyces qaidamensis TaxID=1783515 RepID=UPI00366460DA
MTAESEKSVLTVHAKPEGMKIVNYSYPHWIDNAEVHGGSVELDVHNPATGEVTGTVRFADEKLVTRAVESAAAAFPGWRDLPHSKRAAILLTFRSQLLTRIDDLAAAITAEHGKTLNESRGEVLRAIETLDIAFGAGNALQGRSYHNVARGIDTVSHNFPLGVCVGVAPFNFPVLLALMPLVMAVASGNTFILKPSELDPAASILLAQIAREAGFPPGVFTVLHGGKEVVEALIDSDDVAAVAFVGSTPVAHSVSVRAAQAGKRSQAFGGAKNHLIALADADLSAVADAAVSGAFGCTGQRCMAVSVLVAERDIADELVELVVRRSAALVVGDGRDPGTQIGPLVSQAARERVLGHVDAAIAAGAEPLLDRSREVPEGLDSGYFVGPVVLDNVTPDMAVYQEEIFGPVLVVVRVDGFDEALELVNSHRYGNGAVLFTDNGPYARRFQQEVQAGQIGVNVPVPVPTAAFGSSGWNASAFGDTQMNAGAWPFFTRPKFVTTQW